MTTPIDYGHIRRRILEGLPEAAKSSPAKPFVNYRYLPVATQYSAELILAQLEILESEGRVELRRLDDECAVKLTPPGLQSLEVPEGEWQRGKSPSKNRLENIGPRIVDNAEMAATGPHHPKAFVSHSSQDHDFVVKFATDLMANGVKAWYAGWEIKAGDSIRAKIDEGLADCEFFIIVLSKNSINRLWVQKELDAATVRNIGGRVRKSIPVKIEDCGPLPPLLGSLAWEDFSNKPYESAFQRVIHSIFDVDVRPPLGKGPFALKHLTPTEVQHHRTNFPIHYRALGEFAKQLQSEGFEARFDVFNGQIGLIVGPGGLDPCRMPLNETAFFFPLWELNYEVNRPLVDTRNFHEIFENRPKDWNFNQPYKEYQERPSEDDTVMQPSPTQDNLEVRVVGPDDIDLVLETFHSKDGRHGILARFHNRRTTNLSNCTLIVRDTRSFDAHKGALRESWGFKPVRTARLDCAAGFDQGVGWLLRIEKDHLEVGDTVDQGVMQWPTGDKSGEQRWRLLLSVTADGLKEWMPEVDLEWLRGSETIRLRPVSGTA